MLPRMLRAGAAEVSSRCPIFVVTFPVRVSPRSMLLVSCGSRPMSLALTALSSLVSPAAPMLVSPMPVRPASVSMKRIVLMAAKRAPYHIVTGSCFPSVESGMQMLVVRRSVMRMWTHRDWQDVCRIVCCLAACGRV